MVDKKIWRLGSKIKKFVGIFEGEPQGFFWVFLFSFLLRVVFSLFVEFNDDSVRVYALGLDFYLNGTVSPTGAAIVYTGTTLPGGLMSLLAGIPLFISQGLPWALGCFVAILNQLAGLLIYKISKDLFKNIPRFDLAIFIFLAPWTYLYIQTWNPSFLPFFSAMFFYGLLKINSELNRFWGSFLVAFSLICLLQIHMSFVLLPIILVGVLVLGWSKRPTGLGFVGGLSAGSLGMIPFFMLSGAGHEGAKQDFLIKNIQLHWDHLKQWPAYFLRFLSFSTGEITHFIGTHHGFGGALEFYLARPVLFPFFILVLLSSVVLVLISLSFYLKKFKGQIVLGRIASPVILFRTITLIFPPVAGLLFFFSSQGPSSHTFWILMPLSFFALFYVVDERKWLGASKKQLLWRCYCGVALIFSLVSYSGIQHEILWSVQRYALQVSRKELLFDQIPTAYQHHVSVVLRALTPTGTK